MRDLNLNLFGRVDRRGTSHGDGRGDVNAEKGEAERQLRPVDKRRYTITLNPGKYVPLCCIPGHYLAGRHTTLVDT